MNKEEKAVPKETFSDFQSPHEASVEKLTAALERAYHRPGLMMWRSFLQGIMNAFGNAIGWVLIIVISGYIFQALGGIDLLKEPIEKARQGIEKSVQTSVQQTTQNLQDAQQNAQNSIQK